VSSFFADIFRNNSLNAGLLPVIVPEDFLKKLFGVITEDPATIVRIDLPQQIILIPSTGDSVSFDINPYKKECFIKGLDDVDYLLKMKDRIRAYELRNTLRK
jgi:3-isopropylmalate/(R)-2-methylmalate dehydratase small subunit